MGFLKKLKCEAHPEHPVYLSFVEEPFVCDGCNDLGIGCCYQCKDPECVDLQIHEECARPTPITCHPFSKGCEFIFTNPSRDTLQQKPGTTVYRICDACGTYVGGFFYACYKHGKQGHFIHPSCLNLKNRIQFSEFDLVLNGNVPKKCDICGHKHAFDGIKGWSYVSSCGRLCLHIKCVKEMMLDNWKKIYLRKELGISIDAPASTTFPTLHKSKYNGSGSINTTSVGMPLVVHGGKTGITPLSVLKQAGKTIGLLAKALSAVVSSYFGVSAGLPGADVVIKALTSN